MYRPTLLAALTLSLALVSCGGSTDPRDLLSSASRSLGAMDYDAALADFTAAQEAIGDDSSNSLHADIQEGLLFAQAGAAPADALATLKARADEMGDNIDVGTYMSVASHMTNAENFDEAVKVVGLAKDKFGENETLDLQAAIIVKTMESAGATDALSAMAGLGYVGE